MTYQPVTHVIFDLDGTVMDTEGLYTQVIADMGKKYGQEYKKEIQLKLTGRNERDTIKILLEEWNLPMTSEQFLQEYGERCEAVLPGAGLMPGVERLIKHLHKHGVPIAIATSSSLRMVEVKTAHLKEFFNMFHHVVSGSSDPEVKKGKPHPDIFLVCASRFDDRPDPTKCLVFEDAISGAQGALAAGMQVVHIPDPMVDRSLCKMSTLVLDSMEQFIPELFDLPAYD